MSLYDRATFRLPDNYYDPPEIDYRELSHSCGRANKDHECSWCHKTIPAGENYYRVAHITDGEFVFDKIHRSCYHGDDRR